MRDPSASFDPPPAPSATFALPDADLVRAAWADPPPGSGFPSRPDKTKSACAAMLGLGVALLFFVPISGVFFLVAGGLGLTIASEASAGVSRTNT
jgi:hypothetical protein